MSFQMDRRNSIGEAKNNKWEMLGKKKKVARAGVVFQEIITDHQSKRLNGLGKGKNKNTSSIGVLKKTD